MKVILAKIKTAFSRFVRLIDARPLLSFFGLLAILFVLVVMGNFLRKPAIEEKSQEVEPKLVEVYTNGQSPTMTLTGRVEKSGIITIVAQTGGVVQKVHVTEGKSIGRNTSIISMSATYGGANPASLSRQIAEKNTTFTNETFDLQMDMIAKQRDLANKGNTQTSELREITRKSLDDTRSLITLNEEIVSSLDSQITALTASNVGGVNDSAIAGAKQGKAAALGGLTTLRSTLRSLEYQSADDKTPAQTSNVSKDLTLRQLDLQEKSLVLGKELAGLNLKLARVGESLFYPTSPCSGIVERVYVKVGQTVAPGTPIAQIKADSREASVIVAISPDLSSQVSRADNSVITIGNKKHQVFPRYVSTEATEGGMSAIFYSLPVGAGDTIANGNSVQVSVPMGMSKIAQSEMYIPLDSVYQTQEKSFVYVRDGETAKVKEIVLGEVSGKFVKVVSGLSSTDQVILTRGIADGDSVRTE